MSKSSLKLTYENEILGEKVTIEEKSSDGVGLDIYEMAQALRKLLFAAGYAEENIDQIIKKDDRKLTSNNGYFN